MLNLIRYFTTPLLIPVPPQSTDVLDDWGVTLAWEGVSRRLIGVYLSTEQRNDPRAEVVQSKRNFQGTEIGGGTIVSTGGCLRSCNLGTPSLLHGK